MSAPGPRAADASLVLPGDEAVPLPRTDTAGMSWADAALLLSAVRDLAAAATVGEVAEAAVHWARGFTGARGAAIARRFDRHAEVMASLGYDCEAMAPGARLPLDAGLPLTDSARTGRVVVRDVGVGGWIAVPLGTSPEPLGALVVSLVAAPRPDDLSRLTALARDTTAALHRAARHDRALERAAAVGPLLAPAPLVAPHGIDLDVRVVPIAGDIGGDLVELLPAQEDGAHWLVLADACGNGPRAAATAAALRQAVRVLVRHCADPSALLPDLDRLLTPDGLLDGFASALVLRVCQVGAGLEVAVASAGHLPPMLLTAGGLAEIHVNGPLLGQGLDHVTAADFPTVTLTLRAGDAVVAFTDGLVDRWSGDAADLVDGLLSDVAIDAVTTRADVDSGPRSDAGVRRAARERSVSACTIADRLLDGLAALGATPRDDLALAVIRCPSEPELG